MQNKELKDIEKKIKKALPKGKQKDSILKDLKSKQANSVKK